MSLTIFTKLTGAAGGVMRGFDLSRRTGMILLAISMWLVLFGCRLSLVSVSPYGPVFQSDEFRVIEMVNEAGSGTSGLRGLFGSYSSQHRIGPTLLITWLSAWLNDGIDLRLTNILYSATGACYGALCFLLFGASAGVRGRWIVAALVVILFVTPWDTSRAAWSILSCFTFTGIFSLLAIWSWTHLAASRWRVPGMLFFAVMSSFSCGAGVLCAPAIAGIILLDCVIDRRRAQIDEIAAMAGCTALVVFFLTGTGKTDPALTGGLAWRVVAVLKSLAWPLVFTAAGAVLQVVPFTLFGLQFLKNTRRRNPETRFLLTVAGFLVLNCLAIGIFRGENNNNGMPSLRYWQILMLMPLVVFRMLSVLACSPARRVAFFAGSAYALALTAGLGLQVFLRVIPFVSNRSGDREWMAREAQMADILRTLAGVPASGAPVVDAAAAWVMQQGEIESGARSLLAAEIVKLDQALPVALEKSRGTGFVANGYPPGYPSDSTLAAVYGSYQRGLTAPATFVSEPFVIHSPSVEFEFIFDRKAKFRNYKLPELSCKLIRTDGSGEVDLLSTFRTSWPSMLRAQERICIPVVPDAEYILQAEDDSEDGWFAFSEPWPRGRVGPATSAVYNSCWLFVGAGCGLFVLFVICSIGIRLNREEQVDRS